MPTDKSKLTNDSIEKTRQYHERYLRAVNNPQRREILKAIKQGYGTIEALKAKTGLDNEVLIWHLNILEHDFCVEKDESQGKTTYKLTKEGRIVDYLE